MLNSGNYFYMRYATCPMCKTNFISNHPTRIYCSDTCKLKARLARDRNRYHEDKQESLKTLEAVRRIKDISKPKYTIDEVLKLAEEKGMSYGEYVAKYL